MPPEESEDTQYDYEAGLTVNNSRNCLRGIARDRHVASSLVETALYMETTHHCCPRKWDIGHQPMVGQQTQVI